MSEDLNSAVVYAYFRVGDNDRDVTGISQEDFEAQIAEISKPDNGYNLASLDSILKAQTDNTPLANKTIALTFEGTDSSFMRNAFPLLEKNKIPFTLFISPGLIEQAEKAENPMVMSWDDIKTIAKSNLAIIGMTSYSYTHVDGKTAETLTSDINHAREIFRDKLDFEPAYFAYPYGEYTPNFLTAISKQGFVAAFGQQSGVVSKSMPRMVLPRFTMTDNFSDIERFRMTALSLPFPVSDIEPTTTVSDLNPPHPGFTVSEEIPAADLKKIKCFASGIEKIDAEKIGARHFEIRFSNPFEDSKGRLNCTIPVSQTDDSSTDTDEVRWRWLGFQFTVPEAL